MVRGLIVSVPQQILCHLPIGVSRDAVSQPQQLPSDHFGDFDFLIALASQQVMLIVFDNGFAQLQI